MKKEIAFRLADILESGVMTKGTSRLAYIANGEYKFCCLGVLCEEYNRVQKQSKKKQLTITGQTIYNEVTEYYEPDSAEIEEFSYDKESELPPENVRIWAGCNRHQFDTLAETNDMNPDDKWKSVIALLRNDPNMWIVEKD